MSKILIAVLMVFLPAAAQIVAPPRVGVGVTQRKLTLAEAIEMAMQSNLEIEIQKTDVDTAQEAAKGARGYLDPMFRWQPGLESRNTPTSSILFGQNGKLAEHFFSQNFYLQQKLPWQGASLNLGFENSRQSSSNPFVSLNPFVTSRLAFGITQPLLRNRLIDRDRADLQVRNKQVDLSQTDFELKVIDVVSRVEQAYWDLVAARQDVEVQADSVNLAREQLARTQRMIDSGTLAPVEFAAAEAELERRLDTFYSSLGVVTQVENTFKNLVTNSHEDPLWSDEIIPTERETLEPPETGDLRAAVAEAIRRRPELRSVGLRKDTNDIQKRLNADQIRPQLNLVASYANAGLAGSVSPGENPFSASSQLQLQRLNELSARAGLPPLPASGFGGAPAGLIGGYGSVLSDVFGGHFQTVQVGLALDWNPRNSTTEANLAQSLIVEKRLKYEQARLEQGIDAEVRNSLQAIQTAKQRITAAEASARAAQEKLDSEVRLFQTGESTNFLVLTRQNEYADSRRRTLAAHLDFNKAVARLRQALGTTLETHKIRLQ
jgi:outer membrane protein TolC